MKLNFETVIFTDKCRVTLDGPDGRGQAWVRTGMPIPIRMWCQQGGGGVMFWAGIVHDTLVGSLRVPEGVKSVERLTSTFCRKTFCHGKRSNNLHSSTKPDSCRTGPQHNLHTLPWTSSTRRASNTPYGLLKLVILRVSRYQRFDVTLYFKSILIHFVFQRR